MEKLSHLLPGVLQKRGLHAHAHGAHAVFVVQEWMKECFPSLQSEVTARVVKEGVLTIACAHSIALQEVQMRVKELLAYLSTACPQANIREIRLVRR